MAEAEQHNEPHYWRPRYTERGNWVVQEYTQVGDRSGHENCYMDGRLQIKVHTDEWTQVHCTLSSLAVTVLTGLDVT